MTAGIRLSVHVSDSVFHPIFSPGAHCVSLMDFDKTPGNHAIKMLNNGALCP